MIFAHLFHCFLFRFSTDTLVRAIKEVMVFRSVTLFNALIDKVAISLEGFTFQTGRHFRPQIWA